VKLLNKSIEKRPAKINFIIDMDEILIIELIIIGNPTNKFCLNSSKLKVDLNPKPINFLNKKVKATNNGISFEVKSRMIR
jgi:hypothetical protein